MTDRLADIKILIMDVDGVLTDGRLYYTDKGEGIKVFCCKDGQGIRFLEKAGIQSGIITGRTSPLVAARARDLGIAHVHMGVEDKPAALKLLLKDAGLTADQAAFIGDDLPDLPAMRACAVSFAPADAVPEIREAATTTLTRKGGRGAVREAVEVILKASGQWKTILEHYSQ